jgi:DNA-binding LytR/AlgR family response regulator
MNINIHIIEDSMEEKLDIFCHEANKERLKEIAKELVEGNQKITCKKDDKTYQIRLDEVFYIETVDERLFIYCEDDVYENRMRLYEAEQLCSSADFFKASKSMLINIKKIENMKPSLSGRFEITMINKEKLIVSRKYVADLKEKMGL